MIRDLSRTLRAILDDPTLRATFPELARAQIVFDRPTETFNPESTTIDLFLYDLRENMELRSNEPTLRRLNGQVEIRRPPLRVACSYLITAWPVSGSDLALQEHRLLSQVLQVLSSYPQIPETFLRGKLVGQEPPLPMMVIQTDGLKEPAEFWTAVGNKLRPSLTVSVTIGMEIVFTPVTAPVVRTTEVRLDEWTAPDKFRVDGRVTDASNAPVAGAMVTLVDTARQRSFETQTGADGHYTLGAIPVGTDYILRVQSGTTTEETTVTVPASARSDYNVQLQANS